MKAHPAWMLLALTSVCAAQLYEPMSAPFATWVDEGKPVARIEGDLDWVRAKSIGFTQLPFDGLRSYDGDRHDVTIAIEGAPQ